MPRFLAILVIRTQDVCISLDLTAGDGTREQYHLSSGDSAQKRYSFKENRLAFKKVMLSQAWWLT